MNEQQDRVLLNEHVQPIHFEDEHSSLQILERLAWAIREAYHSEEAEEASQPEPYAIGA
jgi:hypothetical protein